jgi:hypothetical protein
MPSDLSIGAIASDPAIRPTETARTAASSSVSASSPSTTPGPPIPTLQLDPALGLVVIEFVNSSGAVTTSIPTQRELTAYREGTAEPPGTHPASVHHSA